MTKNDALILYSLFESLRYEIRAAAPDMTPQQRKQYRKSADQFAVLIREKGRTE